VELASRIGVVFLVSEKRLCPPPRLVSEFLGATCRYWSVTHITSHTVKINPYPMKSSAASTGGVVAAGSIVP